MAHYEYRCRTCGARFEARRPMAQADEPLRCPDGHEDTTRVFSVVAGLVGRSGPAEVRSAGCGPGCACAS
jgi:putative FmdB family regulatory protein